MSDEETRRKRHFAAVKAAQTRKRRLITQKAAKTRQKRRLSQISRKLKHALINIRWKVREKAKRIELRSFIG